MTTDREYRLLRELRAVLAAELSKEVSTLRTRLRAVTRQRDAARGRAAEYRAKAQQYQRELAKARAVLPNR